MREEGKISKSEIEYIINQVKQTQKETAAALAEQPDRSTHRPQKLKSVKSRLLAIAMGVIVLLFAWNVYLQKEETLKSATVVESVQKLATLTTAKAHIKTIVSKEDKKLFGKNISFDFPGTKKTLFMVVPGEMTAGVDLKNLTKKDISLDTKKKEIHITLPHATLVQEPSIDTKGIQTFSSEGLFRSNVVNSDDWSQLEELAKQKLKDEAIQSGLLKTAEDNASLALQDVFNNVNYTVTVTFK